MPRVNDLSVLLTLDPRNGKKMRQTKRNHLITLSETTPIGYIRGLRRAGRGRACGTCGPVARSQDTDITVCTQHATHQIPKVRGSRTGLPSWGRNRRIHPGQWGFFPSAWQLGAKTHLPIPAGPAQTAKLDLGLCLYPSIH